MANDSSMLNIDMVEQFGKNIANVSAQTLEIFSRLGQQLQTVNSVWNTPVRDKIAISCM
mgnify:CR=1 FL=1